MAKIEGIQWDLGRDLEVIGVHCEVADLPRGVDAVSATRGCVVVVLVSSALSVAGRLAAVARELGAMPELASVA